MASFTIHLEDESATMRLGNDLARAVIKGDCLALSGDLGAGKTTLSRALIRTLANDPSLDVPSPTFTLVQSYETNLPVSHFDLYRLNGPEELDELGLSEALEHGVALIEWPQKAGALLPDDAIEVTLEDDGAGRKATIHCPEKATARVQRSLSLRAFLVHAGHASAVRRPFVGDASSRVYELFEDTQGVDFVLMDQRAASAGPPVWKGKAYRDVAHTTNPTVHPFVAIGTALSDKGFATPQIFHRDLDENFLVLEHLGNGSFLDASGKPVAERYQLAAEVLARIHTAGIGKHISGAGVDWELPLFDRDALMIEVSLALDWYLPYQRGRSATEAERAEFFAAWDELFATLDTASYGIMLRDYHSPNLIWRGDKEGTDRLGVLDFQDALWGSNAYDLASLGQDARVTVEPDIEALAIEVYIKARAQMGAIDEAKLRREYALMALQRNTKILGIFIRLNQRDGKPQYMAHLPRIETYVRRTLKASGFSRLQAFYADMGL
jgi:hypothetical protein